MADLTTKITNGISGGAEKVLTAQDISDGYVKFVFKGRGDNNTNAYLAPAVTLKSVDNVLKPMTNFTVNNATAGEVNVGLSGSAVAEVTSVEPIADVGGALGDTYFNIYDGTTEFYVWYNVDAGGTDPTPGGTGIEVAIASDDTAETIASATQTEVDGNGNFDAVLDNDDPTKVLITAGTSGKSTDSADGDTGFTITTVVEGMDSIGEVTAVEGDVLTCVVQPRYPYRESTLM